MPNKYGFDGEVPPNVSLENNIRIALEFKEANPDFSDRINWFQQMVKSNKDHHLSYDKSWDYKQIDRKYADFGNFNYGVVGTVLGFPPFILKWGAGAAQISSNTGKPLKSTLDNALFRKDYGDNPEDQIQIMKGILYAQSLGLVPKIETIAPNFYTTIEDISNYKTIKDHLKELWDQIPANDVYYDQNHKYNGKKLMQLHNPEHMLEYRTVLNKVIKSLPAVANLSELEQLQVINNAYIEKGKAVEYIASDEMIQNAQITQQPRLTPQGLDADKLAEAQAESALRSSQSLGRSV
jgi:Bacterial toxin 44